MHTIIVKELLCLDDCTYENKKLNSQEIDKCITLMTDNLIQMK